jgi:hypothetical protein
MHTVHSMLFKNAMHSSSYQPNIKRSPLTTRHCSCQWTQTRKRCCMTQEATALLPRQNTPPPAPQLPESKLHTSTRHSTNSYSKNTHIPRLPKRQQQAPNHASAPTKCFFFIQGLNQSPVQ